MLVHGDGKRGNLEGAKMNILVVSENFYPVLGGGQMVMWNLCNALSERGHRIYVVTGKEENTLGTEKINNLDIHRPFSAKKSIFGRFINMIKLYFYLKKFLKFKRTDIILSYEYGSFIPATRCARIYNIPIIISLHSFVGKLWLDLTNPFSGFLKYLMEEVILKFAKSDIIQVPAHSTKEAINHRVNMPVTVIPNPIDTNLLECIKEQTDVEDVRRCLDIKKDELFLLFAGALISRKNVIGLIKVLCRLKRKFKLVIVGDGSEREKIEELIKNAGLDGKVLLVGRKSQHDVVLSIIASCDVLIMPSISEELPMVVLEGLALERTVIATRVGDVPRIANMGAKNLYIVDKLEEINQILEKEIRPKKDDSILKEYSMEKIAMKFENLFEEVSSSYRKTSGEGHAKQ